MVFAPSSCFLVVGWGAGGRLNVREMSLGDAPPAEAQMLWRWFLSPVERTPPIKPQVLAR